MNRKRSIIRSRDSMSGKKRNPANWKRTLLHWLGWVLLAAALFYALHRYFEYREQRLDKRLKELSRKVDVPNRTISVLLTKGK